MAVTISGSTGIASGDGSAGSPGSRGTDANSGLFYAADAIKFATGGTERAVIDNNGLSSEGHVLQVVTDIDSGQFVTNSSSWQWQGLDVSITPSSASNKVLVMVGLAMDGQSNQGFITLYSGTDNLGGTEGFGAAQHESRCISGLIYLDSPSSTSAVQYRVAVRNGNNSTTIECPPWAQGKQSKTAMEIAG